MGLLLSRLWDTLRTCEPARILLLGLDAAGKTTIVYRLKISENVCTVPTIGFNVETVEPVPGVKFTVWDIGGQEKIRGLWKPYFSGTQGLIFVVDSQDRERLSEAREELFGIMEAREMTDVPLVVLANKQDMPNAMSPAEVLDGLCLRRLGESGHPWHIQGTCALSGVGLQEAFQEMSNLVKQFKINHR